METKQITIEVELFDQIKELAKKTGRKQYAMAGIIIRHGLEKMEESDEN